MRTITQAAEELKVSRRKIYDENEKLGIKIIKEGRNSFITDADFLKISKDLKNHNEMFGNVKERLDSVLERDRYTLNEKVTDREYTDLKERISFLEKQIGNKDENLKDQLKIKDEQIQAKDNQINGLIQSNFNLTRVLSPPMDEVAATIIQPEIKRGFWSRIFGK